MSDFFDTNEELILNRQKQEVEDIVHKIKYLPGHWFEIIAHKKGWLYLQHHYHSTCADTGKLRISKGRKWYLSSHMAKSEIVQTAFLAAITNAEHEVRENFTYKNKKIFGPHFDVESLAKLCKEPCLDTRKNVTDSQGI